MIVYYKEASEKPYDAPTLIISPLVVNGQDWLYQLLSYHNRQRKKNQQLQLNTKLCDIALKWCENMVLRGRMYHGNVDVRMKQSGVKYSYYGENIAYGFTSPLDVVNNGWMKSPGHRANIVDKDYKYVGFGWAADKKGRLYWTADYIG